LVEATPEPIGIEAVEERLKAFAFGAEHQLDGHAHIVEEDLVVVHAAGEAPDRSDVHARRAIGHDEHAEAAAASGLAARAREHQSMRRDTGMTRPDLVAADHVMVAVAARLGLERKQIRPRVGLAVTLPERRLAARDGGQHLAAQALGAVVDDRVGRLPRAGERSERRAGERQLLEEHELEEHRLGAAAERLGHSMEREAKVMQYVAARGFPAPRVEDVRAGGTELIMERIDGTTMLDVLFRRPWTLRRNAARLATLHKRLHEIAAPGWLESFLGGNACIVHLDLHPLNVILSPNGPVLLDWTNARAGAADADVAV